jgi:hypothetical protein
VFQVASALVQIVFGQVVAGAVARLDYELLQAHFQTQVGIVDCIFEHVLHRLHCGAFFDQVVGAGLR